MLQVHTWGPLHVRASPPVAPLLVQMMHSHTKLIDKYPSPPVYIDPQGNGHWIDITLASDGVSLFTWEVVELPDHLSENYTITQEVNSEKSFSPTRALWDWDHANFIKIKRELDFSLPFYKPSTYCPRKRSHVLPMP